MGRTGTGLHERERERKATERKGTIAGDEKKGAGSTGLRRAISKK